MDLFDDLLEFVLKVLKMPWLALCFVGSYFSGSSGKLWTWGFDRYGDAENGDLIAGNVILLSNYDVSKRYLFKCGDMYGFIIIFLILLEGALLNLPFSPFYGLDGNSLSGLIGSGVQHYLDSAIHENLPNSDESIFYIIGGYVMWFIIQAAFLSVVVAFVLFFGLFIRVGLFFCSLIITPTIKSTVNFLKYTVFLVLALITFPLWNKIDILEDMFDVVSLRMLGSYIRTPLFFSPAWIFIVYVFN